MIIYCFNDRGMTTSSSERTGARHAAIVFGRIRRQGADWPGWPERAGSILIAGTPWLKESPELASLSIPPSKTKGAALDGHSSLLALVLSTANENGGEMNFAGSAIASLESEELGRRVQGGRRPGAETAQILASQRSLARATSPESAFRAWTRLKGRHAAGSAGGKSRPSKLFFAAFYFEQANLERLQPAPETQKN